MPITILDYVKSVVGDKDLYTAEDCLASGVDIIGGCQSCGATIAAYNAYPSTSGYWRCADCIGEDGFATVADFTAHPAIGDLPVLREHRHHQRNPHHHQRTRRGIRAGMRRLRRGLAAMTTTPATRLARRPVRAGHATPRRRLPLSHPAIRRWRGPLRRPADDRAPVRDGRRTPDARHLRRLRRSRPVAAVKTRHPDYYALLGVEPDATTAQIKKAYRKLARLHHPDTNPGDPQAAARFREITEAYDTLTDPDRREAYDRTRPRPRPGQARGQQARRTRPRTAGPPASWSRSSKTPGWPSAAATRRSPRSSSSWPAAPKPASPAGDTSPPAAGTSQHDERAEVMISGEALRLTPAEVLAVILHEAAHALAHARGIKDTSRQGRYHNKQFKTHADELGLAVEHDQRNGWSASKITPDAEHAYARPARRPGRGHDLVAAQRNHHRRHDPAQHQPHRGGLLLRAQHPRRRLHLGRGTHHLPGLRRRLPGQNRR